MTVRFKPGDSVRTPAGHVGTVHSVIQLEKAVEIDVEIVAIERHLEGELDHADHSTIVLLQETRRDKEALAKSLSDVYRSREQAETKAAEAREGARGAAPAQRQPGANHLAPHTRKTREEEIPPLAAATATPADECSDAGERAR
jgi:preprotein translocase subunit YajC